MGLLHPRSQGRHGGSKDNLSQDNAQLRPDTPALSRAAVRLRYSDESLRNGGKTS